MPSPVLARRLITPFRSKLLAEYAVNGFFGGITTSRATVSPMYADADGDLVQYAANNVALVNGDSVACWPGWTNKNTNHNWKPSATTNVTLTDSEGNATLTVVDDTTELEAAGISGNGNAFKIDASANTTTDCYAVIGGATGNTNAHYASAYIRSDGGGTGAELSVTGTSAPATSSSLASNADYVRESFGFTPGNADNQIQVRVTPGETAYFLLNVLTETSYLTAPIEVAGSSVAVDGSEPVVPWPSGLDNNFVLQFTIETGSVVLSSSVYLINIRVDGDNRFIVLYDPSSSFTRTTLVIGGTTYTATINGTLSANTAYKFTILKTVNGMALWKDGAGKQSDTNATADVVFDNEMYLGGRFNQTLTFLGQIREVSIHKVAPNITDAEVLALP